jgi:hypothetical protein
LRSDPGRPISWSSLHQKNNGRASWTHPAFG